MKDQPVKAGVSALFLCFLLSVTGFSEEMREIPLDSVLNSSRADEIAGDREGGWLDLGSNDLRLLPSGKRSFSGIPFDIPALSGNSGKNCLVLGPPKVKGWKKKVQLKVEKGGSGHYLYLLHASAWSPDPEKRVQVGEIKVDFEGGKEQEIHVRCGRDVADWTDSASYRNAARSWTLYNNSTQVSLYVSRFHLKKGEAVKSISFKSEDDHTWMILAATLGDRRSLEPIRQKLTLDKRFRSPPPFEKTLAPSPAGKRPKNIILIIGDGMGQGILRLTSLYQYGRSDALLPFSLPFTTLCTTHSASSSVTDSAASATAFSSGHKTRNGVLGLYERRGKKVKTLSIAEAARHSGRSVGLITSDKLTGATPGGFYAHVPSRGLYPEIALQASRIGYEVMIGSEGGLKYFTERKDGRNLVHEMEERGYSVIRSPSGMKKIPPEKKVLGFLEDIYGEEVLSRSMAIAFDRLSRNPKGFFMMAECTLQDWGGHSNNPELGVCGTVQVEWMTRAAVEFAQRQGETLVLVTADHETGGVTVERSGSGQIVIHYMGTSHTGVPVPLFAYGPGAEQFEGKIDNTDIAKLLFQFWNLSPGE